MTLMTAGPDVLVQLAGHVRELTQHHRHEERYYVWSLSRNRQWRRHITWHAPLLQQLRWVSMPGSSADLSTHRKRGKRTPAPASLDAIDRLQAIIKGVVRWRAQLNVTRRDSLEEDLSALVGAAAAEEVSVREALAVDVDRWRLWCLTLTGWRIPPWRPNAPCPRCEALPGDKTGLRVRLDRATACCVTEGCEAVWSRDTVGVLADYVRAYNAREGAQP